MRLLQSERNEDVRRLRGDRARSAADAAAYSGLAFRVRHRSGLHWAAMAACYVVLAALAAWAVWAWM